MGERRLDAPTPAGPARVKANDDNFVSEDDLVLSHPTMRWLISTKMAKDVQYLELQYMSVARFSLIQTQTPGQETIFRTAWDMLDILLTI